MNPIERARQIATEMAGLVGRAMAKPDQYTVGNLGNEFYRELLSYKRAWDRMQGYQPSVPVAPSSTVQLNTTVNEKEFWGRSLTGTELDEVAKAHALLGKFPRSPGYALTALDELLSGNTTIEDAMAAFYQGISVNDLGTLRNLRAFKKVFFEPKVAKMSEQELLRYVVDEYDKIYLEWREVLAYRNELLDLADRIENASDELKAQALFARANAILSSVKQKYVPIFPSAVSHVAFEERGRAAAFLRRQAYGLTDYKSVKDLQEAVETVSLLKSENWADFMGTLYERGTYMSLSREQKEALARAFGVTLKEVEGFTPTIGIDRVMAQEELADAAIELAQSKEEIRGRNVIRAALARSRQVKRGLSKKELSDLLDRWEAAAQQGGYGVVEGIPTTYRVVKVDRRSKQVTLVPLTVKPQDVRLTVSLGSAGIEGLRTSEEIYEGSPGTELYDKLMTINSYFAKKQVYVDGTVSADAKAASVLGIQVAKGTVLDESNLSRLFDEGLQKFRAQKAVLKGPGGMVRLPLPQEIVDIVAQEIPWAFTSERISSVADIEDLAQTIYLGTLEAIKKHGAIDLSKPLADQIKEDIVGSTIRELFSWQNRFAYDEFGRTDLPKIQTLKALLQEQGADLKRTAQFADMLRIVKEIQSPSVMPEEMWERIPHLQWLRNADEKELYRLWKEMNYLSQLEKTSDIDIPKVALRAWREAMAESTGQDVVDVSEHLADLLEAADTEDVAESIPDELIDRLMRKLAEALQAGKKITFTPPSERALADVLDIKGLNIDRAVIKVGDELQEASIWRDSELGKVFARSYSTGITYEVTNVPDAITKPAEYGAPFYRAAFKEAIRQGLVYDEGAIPIFKNVAIPPYLVSRMTRTETIPVNPLIMYRNLEMAAKHGHELLAIDIETTGLPDKLDPKLFWPTEMSFMPIKLDPATTMATASGEARRMLIRPSKEVADVVRMYINDLAAFKVDLGDQRVEFLRQIAKFGTDDPARFARTPVFKSQFDKMLRDLAARVGDVEAAREQLARRYIIVPNRRAYFNQLTAAAQAGLQRLQSEGVTIQEAISTYNQLLTNMPTRGVAGHYILGADLPWLQKFAEAAGVKLEKARFAVDTQAMARTILKSGESASLQALAAAYGIKVTQQHLAFEDLELWLQVYNNLVTDRRAVMAGGVPIRPGELMVRVSSRGEPMARRGVFRVEGISRIPDTREFALTLKNIDTGTVERILGLSPFDIQNKVATNFIFPASEEEARVIADAIRADNIRRYIERANASRFTMDLYMSRVSDSIQIGSARISEGLLASESELLRFAREAGMEVDPTKPGWALKLRQQLEPHTQFGKARRELLEAITKAEQAKAAGRDVYHVLTDKEKVLIANWQKLGQEGLLRFLAPDEPISEDTLSIVQATSAYFRSPIAAARQSFLRRLEDLQTVGALTREQASDILGRFNKEAMSILGIGTYDVPFTADLGTLTAAGASIPLVLNAPTYEGARNSLWNTVRRIASETGLTERMTMPEWQKAAIQEYLIPYLVSQGYIDQGVTDLDEAAAILYNKIVRNELPRIKAPDYAGFVERLATVPADLQESLAQSLTSKANELISPFEAGLNPVQADIYRRIQAVRAELNIPELDFVLGSSLANASRTYSPQDVLNKMMSLLKENQDTWATINELRKSLGADDHRVQELIDKASDLWNQASTAGKFLMSLTQSNDAELARQAIQALRWDQQDLSQAIIPVGRYMGKTFGEVQQIDPNWLKYIAQRKAPSYGGWSEYKRAVVTYVNQQTTSQAQETVRTILTQSNVAKTQAGQGAPAGSAVRDMIANINQNIINTAANTSRGMNPWVMAAAIGVGALLGYGLIKARSSRRKYGSPITDVSERAVSGQPDVVRISDGAAMQNLVYVESDSEEEPSSYKVRIRGGLYSDREARLLREAAAAVANRPDVKLDIRVSQDERELSHIAIDDVLTNYIRYGYVKEGATR